MTELFEPFRGVWFQDKVCGSLPKLWAITFRTFSDSLAENEPERDNGITRSSFPPLGKHMAGELHDNAEKQTLAPVGVQSDAASLSQNTQTLFSPLSGIRAASELPQSLDLGSPTDIYGKDNVVAQSYQDVRQSGLRTDIVRVALPNGAADRAVFPYRGTEDLRLADCTKDNPQAWNNAFDAFPDLQQYLSKDAGTGLMKALVRNEIHNYDLKDGLGDTMAKYGHADATETLGYPQITPVGLKQFEERYPQLKDFLTSKGYTGQNAEADALRDPSCTPMIVAAKLQSEVDTLKTAHDRLHPDQKIDINWRTLAYTYNADVYYNPKAPNNPDFHANVVPKAKELEHLRGYEKAYPTSDERVLSKSEHLKNVEQQLRLLH